MERTLSRLRGWELDHREQDIRGWPLRDATGRPLGVVSELEFDTETRQLTHLTLGDGRRFRAHDVVLGEHFLTLAPESTSMSSASQRREKIPIAAASGAASTTAMGAGSRSNKEIGAASEMVVPIVDEELEISKRRVEAGGVQVKKHVIEQPVAREVQLSEERLTVERRRVDRPIDGSEAERALHDTTFEVNAKAEKPLVQKRAHVVGEVVLKKEQEQRVEHVRDALRHTEVEITEVAAAGSQRGARP